MANYKTIFVSDDTEDEIEILEYTDQDGNTSMQLQINTQECESYVTLMLHRNAALKFAIKIIETLK